MYADSGYSKRAWDRLMEALNDPENREACGKIVIEPGTDVKQERMWIWWRHAAWKWKIHWMKRITTFNIILLSGFGKAGSFCVKDNPDDIYWSTNFTVQL